MDDLNSVLLGMESIIDRYLVKGIIMHTKDYSMYYGNHIQGVDIEKGLTLGNLLSGTRARTGLYGSQKDCSESLVLELSRTGLAFEEKLKSIELKRCACIVPSRYMEHPRCTIGLGDAFAAGMQLSFIK